MTEQQLNIALWLQRSLRATAESQKFHMISCNLAALGDFVTAAKMKKISEKHAKNIDKLLAKAIKLGFDPTTYHKREKNEKENRD